MYVHRTYDSCMSTQDLRLKYVHRTYDSCMSTGLTTQVCPQDLRLMYVHRTYDSFMSTGLTTHVHPQDLRLMYIHRTYDPCIIMYMYSYLQVNSIKFRSNHPALSYVSIFSDHKFAATRSATSTSRSSHSKVELASANNDDIVSEDNRFICMYVWRK